MKLIIVFAILLATSLGFKGNPGYPGNPHGSYRHLVPKPVVATTTLNASMVDLIADMIAVNNQNKNIHRIPRQKIMNILKTFLTKKRKQEKIKKM